MVKDVDNFDVHSISEKNLIDYILEVDLEYLDELLKLHNDYTLDPEEPAISYEVLSDYCKKNC